MALEANDYSTHHQVVREQEVLQQTRQSVRDAGLHRYRRVRHSRFADRSHPSWPPPKYRRIYGCWGRVRSPFPRLSKDKFPIPVGRTTSRAPALTTAWRAEKSGRRRQRLAPAREESHDRKLRLDRRSAHDWKGTEAAQEGWQRQREANGSGGSSPLARLSSARCRWARSSGWPRMATFSR